MLYSTNKHIFIKNLQMLSKKSHLFLQENQYDHVSRINKTDIFDAFAFKIQYGRINVSKSIVTDELNKFKNINITNCIDRTSYSDRSDSIDTNFYKKYYNFISNAIENIFYNKKNNIYELEIISVDGCKNNMSKKLVKAGIKLNPNKESTTPLCISFYNVTYNMPSVMELVNHKNERKAFMNVFDNDHKHFSNKIYVCDRGFYQLKMIELIHKYNNYFIIRLKSDNLFVKFFVNDIESKKNIILKISDDDLIVKTTSDYIKYVRIIRYYINNKCFYMCTNLYNSDEYSTDYIKNVYHKRWDIEEYFKLLKENTSLRKLKERSFDAIKRTIYGQLITSKLVLLIINFYNKKIKIQDKIVNKSHVMRSIYNEFMKRFIYNDKYAHKFSRRFLENELYYFIEIIITHLNISVPIHSVHTYSIWNKKIINKNKD